MNIGMVLDAPYPEDGRVTKEAVALIAAGHHVSMLCVQRSGEPATAEVNGITVVRIKRGLSMFAKTAWDSLNALIWRHPVFARALPKFIASQQLDALHVHDLPLAGTVARAAERASIPWVLDLHENYPAGLQIWMIHKTNPVVRLKNWLLMSYPRWLAYEGRMVQQAAHVITVVQEAQDRLQKVHATPVDKLSVVTNSEWKDFFAQFAQVPEVAASYPGKQVLLYLGYFGPHRGVDTVIEAMPAIRESLPNAVFVIVGKGSFQADLQRLAAQLGVEDAVEFRGLVPYAEVGSWMQRADINVVPHLRNEHTDHTIPHKLFQGFLSGKPTLVSSAPPLARLVEETQGGFVFEAGNPADLAAKAIAIIKDPVTSERIAQQAQVAVTQGPFNWDTDQLALLKIYRELA